MTIHLCAAPEKRPINRLQTLSDITTSAWTLGRVTHWEVLLISYPLILKENGLGFTRFDFISSFVFLNETLRQTLKIPLSG